MKFDDIMFVLGEVVMIGVSQGGVTMMVAPYHPEKTSHVQCKVTIGETLSDQKKRVMMEGGVGLVLETDGEVNYLLI